MLPGYEYVDTETGIRVVPPNEILSVALPEGKLYLPRRFLAFVIDLITYYAVALGANLGLTALFRVVLNWIKFPIIMLPDGSGFGMLTYLIFGLLSMTSLKVICEGLSSQTLGKKITGLFVVMQDGRPCTLRAALIRSLAIHIDSLFWGLVGLIKMRNNPWKQRHGDVWGKTVVLSSNQEDFQQSGGRTTFLVAFFIALLLQCFISSLWLAFRILS